MNKLIKINEGHYIVVDDSEIKNGEWMYDETPEKGFEEVRQLISNSLYQGGGYWKITRSTQPLEGGTVIHGIEHKQFIQIKYLDISEVEESIYGYNLEDLAFKAFKNQDKWTWSQFKDIFLYSIKYHKELVKDKLFTVEEVKKYHNIMCLHGNVKGEEYIQSLLPKTEWEIKEITPEGKIVLL